MRIPSRAGSRFRRVRTLLGGAAALKLCALSLILAGCVTAGDFVGLRNDVNQLKRDFYEQKREIAGLRADLDNLEGKTSQAANRETLEAMRNSQAMLYDQMTVLDRDVQLLQGKIDEHKYAVDKALGERDAETEMLKARIEEVSGEVKRLAARVKKLEEKLRAGEAAPPAGKAVQKKAPVTEEGVYQQALETFRQGKYGAARKEFEGFLKAYPDSDLADNARFWIAESYYKEGVYEDAILAYETLIKKYPKSDKVPGAMLKQAFAFLELGDRNTTKVILTTLIERFPKSKEAGLARKKLKALESGQQKKKQ